MDKETSKGGRPPKPPEEKRSEVFKFVLTPDEKSALRKAADYYGFDDISSFVRFRIMEIVKAANTGSREAALQAEMGTAAAGIERLDLDLKSIVLDIETGEVKIES